MMILARSEIFRPTEEKIANILLDRGGSSFGRRTLSIRVGPRMVFSIIEVGVDPEKMNLLGLIVFFVYVVFLVHVRVGEVMD